MTADFVQSSTSTAQTHWTCSVCGERVPYGELHLCGERAELGPAAGVWGLAEEPLSPRTYTSLSGTSTAGYWVCPHCGATVPASELHICPGRENDFTGSWPPKPDFSDGYPYTDNVTTPPEALEARRVAALERIADALEKLAQGNG